MNKEVVTIKTRSTNPEPSLPAPKHQRRNAAPAPNHQRRNTAPAPTTGAKKKKERKKTIKVHGGFVRRPKRARHASQLRTIDLIADNIEIPRPRLPAPKLENDNGRAVDAEIDIAINSVENQCDENENDAPIPLAILDLNAADDVDDQQLEIVPIDNQEAENNVVQLQQHNENLLAALELVAANVDEQLQIENAPQAEQRADHGNQRTKTSTIISSTACDGKSGSLNFGSLDLSGISVDFDMSSTTRNMLEHYINEATDNLESFNAGNSPSTAVNQISIAVNETAPALAAVNRNSPSLGEEYPTQFQSESLLIGPMMPNMSLPENMIDSADREIIRIFHSI